MCGMKIKDLPKSDRPREKLVAKGAENLKDSELLAILLRTGKAGKNVIEIASQILTKHSKKRLLQMTYQDLVKIGGIGRYPKSCTLSLGYNGYGK